MEATGVVGVDRVAKVGDSQRWGLVSGPPRRGSRAGGFRQAKYSAIGIGAGWGFPIRNGAVPLSGRSGSTDRNSTGLDAPASS